MIEENTGARIPTPSRSFLPKSTSYVSGDDSDEYYEDSGDNIPEGYKSFDSDLNNQVLAEIMYEEEEEKRKRRERRLGKT